jgi:hypothetical protein
MPIKTYTMDQGLMSVGAAGTVMDMTAQVRNVTVEFSEDVGDDRPTLSGDVLAGKAKYPASVKGTVIQDLSDGGLVEYTWTNRGKVLPFTITPSTTEGRAITGMLRVSPLDVGGDAGEEGPESDFEWSVIGDPVLGEDLS